MINATTRAIAPVKVISKSVAEPSGKLSARVIREKPTTAVKPEVPSSVDYIKELFSETEKGRSALKRKGLVYTPPEDAIEAYSTELVAAVRSRNVEKLRGLLKEGKTFDACNRFGESIIHMACRIGDVNVLKFLLEEAKVDIEVRDDFNRTILHDACWTHTPKFDAFDLLIEHVPAYMLVMEDVRGHSPFHYARKEHADAWTEHLEKRKDVILQRISLLQEV